MKYYTGIGSRSTPTSMQEIITGLAIVLADKGWVLRSGRAEGADAAFQLGAESVKTQPEIYVPWADFNKNIQYLDQENNIIGYSLEAKRIASEIHPAWDKCSQGAQKLHTRNVYQILGRDLNTPSKFVLYWAKESATGAVSGGTATAVNLARKFDIPTINMYFNDWEKKLSEVLENEDKT